MASNESYDRIRANKFSTKHVFGQKKKARVQQLRDASANRKFSAAKQLDSTAEVQSCIVTADDESATPRMPAMAPRAGSGVGSRTVAQVKRRGERRASIQGWRI